MDENAQAIQYMLDTVGWQLVDAHIRGRIEAAKNQLMSCPIEDVPKHRAEAKALNGVLVYIQETMQEGREPDA